MQAWFIYNLNCLRKDLSDNRLERYNISKDAYYGLRNIRLVKHIIQIKKV